MIVYDVLIVGAGHAGAQAAATLRQRGFEGSVGMIGDESELPYERPPLSKEYLSGDRTFDRLLIRPPAFWQDKSIDVVTGTRVIKVDPAVGAVVTNDGRRVGYRNLIWSAGGEPRRLTCEGHDLLGVHTVRSRADVDRLVGELSRVDRVVVVGGGFIGLEAAAVLTKLGKSVVVLEAQDRLLARVCGEEVSRFYEAQHRSHGVDVRLNTVVSGIVGNNERACGVTLAGGEIIPCEMVIVGIGIVPAVEPLLTAGALIDDGVVVDEYSRTTIPSIYAIGDCARRPSRYAGGLLVRLESVHNTAVMAAIAVIDIIGGEQTAEPAPWFWSNQFDLRLQTIGLSVGYDATVIRGDGTKPGFSVVYLKEGHVIALDCINSAKDFAQGKALVTANACADPQHLADTNIPLRDQMLA